MTTNKQGVQRYTDMGSETVCPTDNMCKSDDGNYVLYEDYKALQAECDALRAKTSMSIGVGDGTGNLFVHGDYDSIKRVQELLFECEKLRKDAVQGEPVAWMHNDPSRVDVIHESVRSLLKNLAESSGHFHRPLDRSERYTIPLYTTPQPAEQQPAPDVTALVGALVTILEHDSPINIVDTATATERDIFDIARAALAAHRKGGDK